MANVSNKTYHWSEMFRQYKHVWSQNLDPIGKGNSKTDDTWTHQDVIGLSMYIDMNEKYNSYYRPSLASTLHNPK